MHIISMFINNMFNKFYFNKKAMDFEAYEIIYEDAASEEIGNITSLEYFLNGHFKDVKKDVKKESGSINNNFNNVVKNVTPRDLFHAKLDKIVEEDIVSTESQPWALETCKKFVKILHTNKNRKNEQQVSKNEIFAVKDFYRL